MRRTHLAVCAATFCHARRGTGRGRHAQDMNSSRLERAVTVEGIHEHQKALQTIADLNGGTRHTRTPGYIASAAYVKATLEKAGYDARYEMFNMPEWQETAPPVLQLTSRREQDLQAGHGRGRQLAAVDFIAFEHSPTKAVSARGRPRRPHRDPGRRRQHERLRRGRLTRRRSRARSR